MKRFTKIMLILAAFIFVFGFAITAAAKALGGRMPRTAVINNGWYDGEQFHVSHSSSDHHEYDTMRDYEISDEDTWEIEYEDMISETVLEELADLDVAFHEVGAHKLEISVEAAGVEIIEGDTEGSIYLAEAGKYIEWEQEIDDDTLKLTIRKKKGTGNKISSWDSQAYRAVLVLPKGEEFHEMEINVGAGSVEADRITVNKLELEAGAGSISIGSGSVRELKIDSQAGSVIYTGKVDRELEVDCQAGSAEVYLSGTSEDFNYDLKVSMGSIEIDGTNYGGLDKEKILTNEDAWKKAELNCEVGSIELVFYKE